MINKMENQSKCTSGKNFIFNGIGYKSCLECCKILGINYGSVRTRTYELKCSKAEAIQHFLDVKENKKFIFNGVEYDSYFECCRILDVNYNSVQARVFRFNCTRQEAIEYFLSKPAPKMNRKFIFNGVEYENFKECCSAYGVNHFNVATRASSVNCSKEEALQYYLDKANNKKFIFNGIEYNSFRECCESLGLSYNTVYSFTFKYKITKEEAIQRCLDNKKNRKFMFNGVEYDGVKSCCKALGVNYTTINKYASKINCSKEEAIQHCLDNKKNRKFVFNGIKYDNFKECCKLLDINYGSVCIFLYKSKCTKEEAIQHFLDIKYFIFNGVKYNSFRECCESLGINYGSVCTRCYRSRCTKEEAIQHFLDRKK